MKKWIDTPDVKRYDAYIARWHYFLKTLQKLAREDEEGTVAKTISMYVLKTFYLAGYNAEEDVFAQIEARIQAAERLFAIA